MDSFDYIIVGAGSAGCVLANRLSESPDHRVLLIEAGDCGDDLMIRMPRGVGKLLAGSRHLWQYDTEPEPGTNGKPERWIRGKTLGGSSSVNGMVWVRGQPEDYDALEAMGCSGWNWATMLQCFRRLENHALGDNGVRGVGGPFHIAPHGRPTSASEAFITAGTQLGLPRLDDMNGLRQEGVGYTTTNICEGQRVSAMTAMLDPARARPNLTVITDTRVDTLLFEGRRAVGVNCRHSGQPVSYRARREVILCAGGLESPLLLQRSGIGCGDHLQSLGIEVLIDNPAVGAGLREHRALLMQHPLRIESDNRELRGLRLIGNLLAYLFARRGAMSVALHETVMFYRSRPGLDRPDAECMVVPVSFTLRDGIPVLDREPGFHSLSMPLRPESQGYLRIRAADPDQPPEIRPNYLTAEQDCRTSVAIYRFLERLFAQPALRAVLKEQGLSNMVRSDDQIIDLFHRDGSTGYHTIGTCSMGGAGSVVDPQLRVRGVDGLRVVDCSVFPIMIAGHTNAPTLALAWRAADLVLGTA